MGGVDETLTPMERRLEVTSPSPAWWRDRVTLGCLMAGAAGALGLALVARLPGPSLAGHAYLLAFFCVELAVLTVIPVSVLHADHREEVELGEAFLVPMVVLLAPWVVVLVVILTTAFGQVIRKNGPLKALFNLGQSVAAATLGLLLFIALRDPQSRDSARSLAAAAAAAFVYAAVSSTAVAAIITVSRRASFRTTLLEGSALRAAAWVGSISFGIIVLAAYEHFRWVLLVTAVPIVALQVGFTSALGQARERRRVEELYRAAASVRAAIDRVEILARLRSAVVPLLDAQQASYVSRLEAGPVGSTTDLVLRTEVDTLSVLEVVRHRGEGPWKERDRRLLRTIVDVAASALDKAQLFEEIKHQALYDALTGLPNQLLLEDRVIQALGNTARTDSCLALAYVDLDQFKRINDSLGHAAGNELLIAASRRLETATRGTDTVARMGGDEFVVLLPNVESADGAGQVGQKLVEAFSEPFVLGGLMVYCTASVGIALYPQHGLQYGVLLQKSDLALHEAKVRGRGHFRLYAASMGAGTEARLSLESDLRTAVGNDQLRVMYQPQIDLRSGAVVGAEALVRWQHPTEGLLGPDRFIPLAEDLGLVSAIDHWVLEETCAQLRRWHDAGLPPLRVAVNLSGADLGRPDVAASILATIRASGIDPAQIEVEVTETLAMQETQDSRSTLQSLRDQGVGVAIDDFGTGHSSLARLGAFPVDVLKIDKSFIDPVVAAASEAPLVVAIIAMAHSLGLSVVAEGVERIEQLYLLRELGCDRAQGFLLGRPVPAAQFERLVPPVQVPPV